MSHDPVKISDSHIENLAYYWSSLKVWSTSLKCKACSSSLLEYTKISSIKMIINQSKDGLNFRFIKSNKNAGALVNLKDIAKPHSCHIPSKCSFRYISTSTPQLIISWPHINLRKTSNSLKLDQTRHQSIGENINPSQ